MVYITWMHSPCVKYELDNEHDMAGGPRAFKVRYVVTIRHAELANLAFVDACYSPVPLVLQAYINLSSSVHRGTGQESDTTSESCSISFTQAGLSTVIIDLHHTF